MTMNNYKSNYTDKSISPAQYLAERICERLAKKEGTELPYKFWSTVKWKRTFLYQVQIANALLKIYKPEAIIAALRKNTKIFSLNAKFLDPLIQVEQEVMERRESKQEEVVQPIPTVNTTEKPRPAFTQKKSTLNKLREA